MNVEQLTGQSETHLVSTKVGQKAFLVHRDVAEDLLRLANAAQQAGFNFHIASGFRSFERQAAIWNNKMLGHRPILDSNSQPLDATRLTDREKIYAILRWSALPGASRHHWGSDFDVFDKDALPENTSLALEPWEYLTGHQSKFYHWLVTHAEQFGFYFPYREDKGGVAAEPWHISHRHVAHDCLKQLTPAMLIAQLSAESIEGAATLNQEIVSIYTQFVSNISL
ncbi:M15 family metallopeptidase [Vibrio mexicanus]|uniref:M15 family metallopeptidase n=1 Tax=Vibrio mexicanus TaxID=1004326 RepID=UPI00063C0349|nr:M15 family metallopeptidase [Vibrio mexicanus]